MDLQAGGADEALVARDEQRVRVKLRWKKWERIDADQPDAHADSLRQHVKGAKANSLFANRELCRM